MTITNLATAGAKRGAVIRFVPAAPFVSAPGNR